MYVKMNDMTKSSPLKLYIRFAVPMIISDIFYQLYTLIDGIVASRLIGINAFAAISTAGFIYLFVLEAVMGFSHGIGTRFAQSYGANHFDKARNSVAISIVLAVLIGTILSITCLFITKPALKVMNTPLEIIEVSKVYLYCMFAGLIPTFFYKIISSVFFGMGDSKTPLIALILGSITDTILTVILVLTTSIGIAAIGISTILGQLVSSAYLFFRMSGNRDLHLAPNDFKISFSTVSDIFRISMPVSARNAVSALGGVVIQYVINGYGIDVIAGIAAAKRLYVLLFIVANAMEPAIITFVAQNFGARKLPRLRDGMQTAKRIMIIYSASIVVLMFFLGPWSLIFLLGDAEVSLIAINQLRICLIFLPMLYMLLLYRSGLQGMGKTKPTLISGIIEGVLRIAAIFILPLFFGIIGLYISEIIAWPICAAQLFVSYSAVYRCELKKDKESRIY